MNTHTHTHNTTHMHTHTQHMHTHTRTHPHTHVYTHTQLTAAYWRQKKLINCKKTIQSENESQKIANKYILLYFLFNLQCMYIWWHDADLSQAKVSIDDHKIDVAGHRISSEKHTWKNPTCHVRSCKNEKLAINTPLQFSSRWYLCAGESPYMRSTLSLRSFSNIAFETVPILVWVTLALSRPLKENHWALPLSTSLSSRHSMVWWPWLCAHK